MIGKFDFPSRMLASERTRKSPLEFRREAHTRGLHALHTLTTTTDPLEKETAFIELREAVENETSSISLSDLAGGEFDLCSIEWKWRLLEELTLDPTPAWCEAAQAMWRWTSEF